MSAERDMADSWMVSSPRRLLSLSKSMGRAHFSISDSEEKKAGGFEHGTKPSEVYGFVGSISTVVATDSCLSLLALSGWLFRIVILAMWILPFAAPLLIGTVANNFVIEGSCPACKRRFMGYKNQIIQCTNCRAVVWQPRDGFSGGRPNSTSSPDIIDIEIEEKTLTEGLAIGIHIRNASGNSAVQNDDDRGQGLHCSTYSQGKTNTQK
ncbi:hypothetical protein EJ110_NYTH47427 [Nymphaea thermarum]|nr:hypothetical protein EJ110_NYTH47427 [Nymphaea thermarum]